MRIEIVTVTPEKAAELLKKNIGNRPISQKMVDRLVAAMKSGEWKSNGDTIGFCDGALIDGQHRLSAIIAAEIPVECILVHDVDKGSFATKDTGKKRTIADTLHVMGEVNTARLSSTATAAMSIMAEWDGKKMPNHSGASFSTTAVLDFIAARPHIREIASHTQDRYCGRPSIAGALRVLVSDYGGDASEFVARVNDGIGLSANSPAYILRDVLLRNAGSGKSSLSRRWEAAQWIRCWNSWRAGKDMRLLRFKDGEEFPRLAP